MTMSDQEADRTRSEGPDPVPVSTTKVESEPSKTSESEVNAVAKLEEDRSEALKDHDASSDSEDKRALNEAAEVDQDDPSVAEEPECDRLTNLDVIVSVATPAEPTTPAETRVEAEVETEMMEEKETMDAQESAKTKTDDIPSSQDDKKPEVVAAEATSTLAEVPISADNETDKTVPETSRKDDAVERVAMTSDEIQSSPVKLESAQDAPQTQIDKETVSKDTSVLEKQAVHDPNPSVESAKIPETADASKPTEDAMTDTKEKDTATEVSSPMKDSEDLKVSPEPQIVTPEPTEPPKVPKESPEVQETVPKVDVASTDPVASECVKEKVVEKPVLVIPNEEKSPEVLVKSLLTQAKTSDRDKFKTMEKLIRDKRITNKEVVNGVLFLVRPIFHRFGNATFSFIVNDIS